MWKDILGYEGLYEINDLGEVRAKERTIINKNGKPQKYPSKILKPDQIIRNHTTYYRVTLCKDHKTKRYSVHQLVAQTFIPNPSNKDCINHIDNNGTNNTVSNLEWCSHSENMIHAQKQGRLFSSQSEGGKRGSLTNLNKLQAKLDAIANTYVNDWLVLDSKIVESRGGKNYVQGQCRCGYKALLESGRLLRQELTSCITCSRLKRKGKL